jgi:hypothetical protein
MLTLFKKYLFFAVAAFFIFLLSAMSVQAIAQVSKPIVIDNAVAGQKYDKILTLYNTDSEKVKFTLQAIGDIAKWTEFYANEDKNEKIDSIEIEADSTIDVVASFVLPVDAPVATYEGSLVFGYAPVGGKEKTDDKSMQILSAVGRKVKITTGGIPTKQCDCQYISMGSNVLKTGQFEVNVTCTNTGNVAIKPVISQKIYKDDNIDAPFLEVTHSYKGDEAGILPGRMLTIPIKYAVSGLEFGNYKSEFQSKIDDTLMDGEILEFSVVKPLQYSASLSTAISSIVQKFSILIGIAGIIIAIIVIFFIRKMFLQKQKSL